jgi:hypothetical protein
VTKMCGLKVVLADAAVADAAEVNDSMVDTACH